MKTVCILYGFCEGPRVSKRFQADLEAEGYKIISDPSKADVIIGHSGGCFLLPEHLRAKHIIQIGLVHWPGRSVVGSLAQKLIADIRNHHQQGAMHFWLRKALWNFYYFWNIPATIRMLIGRKRGYHWRYGKITTVVRPDLDSFCTPKPELLPFKDKPRVVCVPGQHDDCWRDPKPYLSLIKTGKI